MPMYEYECTGCGKIYSRLYVKASDADNEIIECGCGSECKRIISMSSFHLKGRGWYKTDYQKPECPVKEDPDLTSFTTKTPIIKDRNTGATLVGPEIG
jgi:putative FmdB family regulatory protein